MFSGVLLLRWRKNVQLFRLLMPPPSLKCDSGVLPFVNYLFEIPGDLCFAEMKQYIILEYDSLI